MLSVEIAIPALAVLSSILAVLSIMVIHKLVLLGKAIKAWFTNR